MPWDEGGFAALPCQALTPAPRIPSHNPRRLPSDALQRRTPALSVRRTTRTLTPTSASLLGAQGVGRGSLRGCRQCGRRASRPSPTLRLHLLLAGGVHRQSQSAGGGERIASPSRLCGWTSNQPSPSHIRRPARRTRSPAHGRSALARPMPPARESAGPSMLKDLQQALLLLG